jgi:nicotinate-nucleotide adenylyltransferase
MRFGIFGGTFNPIHYGHLRAAEEVRYKAGLDKVIFIPSGNPPLKTEEIIEASHRYSMVRIATASNPYFVVSDIEITEKEKSYTVNTIKKLRDIYPDDELFLILGIDAFLDIPNWWKPYDLINMIDFILITRPGFEPSEVIIKSPFVKSNPISSSANLYKSISLISEKTAFLINVTAIDISSTEIRKLLKENKSIKYLLPESIEEYIHKHNIYRG